jgi:hypothetical protein
MHARNGIAENEESKKQQNLENMHSVYSKQQGHRL